MFGRKDALPFHGSPSSNGVKISAVNTKVLLSLAWVCISVFLMIYGYRHCVHGSVSSTFSCVDDKCSLSFKDSLGAPILHEFARKDLVDADIIRVHEGKMVSISGVKRKVASTYGYSVQLKYKLSTEEGSRIKMQQSTLLSADDIGRRVARSTSSKINKYMDGKDEKIDVVTGSSWTAVGVLCIIFGLVSSICSCLFGQFADPTPKRLRKTK